MVDIIHRIGIKSSASNVYKAITTLHGLSNWWTEEVSGNEGKDGKIDFTFRTKAGDLLGKFVMEVQELNSGEYVRWRCLEGPAEWVGTDIDFRLSQQGEQTIIIFGHRNWQEAVEFMSHCSMKWATFLLSLREYVETGKVKPSPSDLKIDNWN
ncbi:MAG: SRPBCC domain-containing protein [Moraxellaceae bacterium]|nr:MAG: SRPBCC domain-containing protein [Moraxellaceae bacterium]